MTAFVVERSQHRALAVAAASVALAHSEPARALHFALPAMLLRHVLVATDFDDCSEAALEHAVALSEHAGASLTVMHAVHVPYGYVSSLMGELMTQLQDRARTQLEQLVEPIRARLPRVEGVVRWGVAWEQILDVARGEKGDVVVIGARGHRLVPHSLLGSVAEKVVRMATIPVLTVPCPPPR
jgi:nucleotide-binding universal stress UspA family protein